MLDVTWNGPNMVHLGITLSDDGSMEQDVKVKRALFIDECHNLQDEFRKTHPDVQAKMMTLYNSSCYGSNTWNLFGEWTRKLLVSWNVNLKQIWQLPHQTHRFFFEHLTECRHLKILLIRRLLKFLFNIIDGDRDSCRLLLRTICKNANATTGRNLRNIEGEAGIMLDVENLKSKIDMVSDKVSFADIPLGESWKINAVKELSKIKSNHLQVDEFTSEEVDEMLQFICVS